MARTALYAGSFDPITNGHVDIIRATCRVADRVVLAIGTHPGKQPLFTVEERLEMLRLVAGPVAKKEKVEIDAITFNGLVITAARRAGATLLIRGLRDGTDFNYEMQMAGMNAEMSPKIQTVFLPASTPTRPITATLVRQIAAMGGDISAFVPAPVAKRLVARFARKS